jgi:hypothetical protein
MESWQKFSIGTLDDPRLAGFRPWRLVKAFKFLALSCSYGQLGVVDFYDDDIRARLNLSMAQWLDLRDEMVLRGLIRQVERENGRHFYEVAHWFLPDQTSTDRKYVDSRSSDAWGDPVLPPDQIDSSGNKSSMTPAERKALQRHREKAFSGLEPLMSKEMFLVWYRQGRNDSPLPPAAAPSPISAAAALETFMQGAPVTVTAENVTDDVTRGSHVTENQNEKNNNRERERARESVTERVTEEPPQSVTRDAEDPDFVVVVSALRAEGIDAKTAPLLVQEFGVESCRLQLAYWPLRKADFKRKGKPEPGGGMLRTSIECQWAPPKGWTAQQGQKARSEQETARRDQEAQQRLKAAEDAEAARARMTGYWLTLAPEAQAQIEAQARDAVPPILRGRSNQAAQTARDEAWEQLVRAHMTGSTEGGPA